MHRKATGKRFSLEPASSAAIGTYHGNMMRLWLETIRRFCFISSVVLWLGGFTFYAGVVVPTGASVLHSHHRQGLITQQVTVWLNLISIPALLFILWNTFAAASKGPDWARWIIWLTWWLMAAVQATLFALHRPMDRLIDPLHGSVIDSDRFERLHTWYGMLSTTQWGAGVLHVLIVLYVWAAADSRTIDRETIMADPQLQR